jgi:3-oxoacyl-[acyl-carrier-protein] synthase-3
MDLSASCSGFLYALDAAARAVVTGDDCVLAVAADIRSRYLDVTDRATCALFADGAGAAVLTAGPVDTGLVAIGLMAEGSGAHSIHVPAGGSREPATAESVAARRHTIRMADGPQIYLSAVEGMLLCAESLLDACGLTFGDIDLMVPHQANHHILKRVAWKAKFPLDKVYINIDRVGNISGATTAVGLDEALASGRIGAGSKVLLVAAGAGYTGGAALLVVDEALAARYQNPPPR